MFLPKQIFAASLIGLCLVTTMAAQPSDASSGKVTPNRAPLKPNAYNPLPLGAVEPQGWLRKQLELQASGLTGHLDEFWKDVGSNSGWLGGTGESWERGPYYLDGLLPLAYQLQNPALIEKAKKWVDWTLTHQRADGQIGPAGNDDWWPRMVMLKVLTQYQEVTGDPRVIPLMTKYFAYELKELPSRPLRDWGKYRWQDNAYTVIWLYNRTGDKDLLKLIKLLHDQGYDWERQFANFKYTEKITKAILGPPHKGPPPDAAMQTHGVNNAMALKVAPVWWLMTGNEGDRKAFDRQLEMLDKYHGLPNGMFSGDEHFAGIDPSQGIELCAVVETMFSLEEAFAVLGDPRIGDRLEKATYNALPATLSDDMWSHQYDQQPNQIACTRARRQWSTNGDDSNLFGLEPNFGCCTANLHQGWPKFVSSLWMANPDAGLVALAYAPNRVHTKVKNVDVAITEQTEYPFRGTVRFTVQSSRPANFPLQLRIPGWSEGGTVTVNGQKSELPQPSCKNPEGNGTAQTDCDFSKSFYTLRRAWKNGDTVEVSFQMSPRVTHWYQNAAVFERGPLVFSLPIKAQWSELKSYAQKSADWQLKPLSKWNYAVELGDCDAKMIDGTLSAVPFSVENPAFSLEVKGRELPQWTMQENSAGPVPLSPVKSESTLQTLTLVPYGAAKLRVTAFPYLNEKSKCGSEMPTAKSGL
jgi:hypothetical protein